MINLNNMEIKSVAGGVTEGPNGESCTDPRKDETTDKGLDVTNVVLGSTISLP